MTEINYTEYNILSFSGIEITQRLKQQLEDVSELASFEGGLYGTKKDNRMRTCNMFILTSHYEGMPMGILEAFSYAVPYIVTPGSNMAEEISRSSAGWVCELSAESIADTIESLH